jgi:uncharacterized repeat protein (TIGR02543 family)
VKKGSNITSYSSLVSVTTGYRVSYNANGGSGAPSAQSVASGSSVKLSSTTPTRSGYTFLGWSKSSTATSASYLPGRTYTFTASTTLYAVWKSKHLINGGGGGGDYTIDDPPQADTEQQ